MNGILAQTIKTVEIAEQHKPSQSLAIKEALDAVKEQVDFITDKDNRQFFILYRSDCVVLTKRLKTLVETLSELEPEKPDLERSLRTILKSLKMDDPTPEKMAATTTAPLSSNAQPKKVEKSCMETPYFAVAVGVAVIGLGFLLNGGW